ncbi:MAG: phenylacetic acid degradation protein PaaN [Proteobacteria bacterium]|nr:phenylacetic acid degradation protein PaaN [Pseudomonadota bacterium]HQR03979.1 phenylacetic acid degradation protein PaaN [Rhodocyclaceae bacterium]
MSSDLFEQHLNLFRRAMAAVEHRMFWSPFSEIPDMMNESAVAAGREAFEAYRDASFYLDQPGMTGRAGGEISPYGPVLNTVYPVCNPDRLIQAARNAIPAWTKAGPEARVGVCLEILSRLDKHGMELAHALMHTTGQSLSFSRQFSVAQALDRGLEAVTCAYRAMKLVPSSSLWEKPQSRGRPPLRMAKQFTAVPRGVALVVTCATLPTWHAYPAIMASLATGNPVLVKPHPGAVLPIAITVAAARMVLREAGFDPNLVSLLVDDETGSVAQRTALKPEIRIIDYAGHNRFGAWLETSASQAAVFVQKRAINAVVIDATDDYHGMLRNLALSICLYSGQMTTSPRLVCVSREGVRVADALIPVDQFCRDLSQMVSRLVEVPSAAAELLGAIASTESLAHIDALVDQCDPQTVLRTGTALDLPQWALARTRTPTLLRMEASALDAAEDALFGPIALIVETGAASESLALVERVAMEKGSLGLLLHSTHSPLQALAEEMALRTGLALSINLDANVLMNQTAGFSDFLGTGINPAANCSFIDPAYVAHRFCFVQVQQPAPG